MSCPYAQLHIYQAGRAAGFARSHPGCAFPGHWPEGDTSCLFFSACADDGGRRPAAGLPAPAAGRSHCSCPTSSGRAPLPRTRTRRAVPHRSPPGTSCAARAADRPADPGDRSRVVFGPATTPPTQDCLLAIEPGAAEGHFRTALGPRHGDRHPGAARRPVAWAPGSRPWS